MFDSTIGRWQTKDPKSFDAGDTNLYRYVGNHPSYATDPSGLEEWDPKKLSRAFIDKLIAAGAEMRVHLGSADDKHLTVSYRYIDPETGDERIAIFRDRTTTSWMFWSNTHWELMGTAPLRNMSMKQAFDTIHDSPLSAKSHNDAVAFMQAIPLVRSADSISQGKVIESTLNLGSDVIDVVSLGGTAAVRTAGTETIKWTGRGVLAGQWGFGAYEAYADGETSRLKGAAISTVLVAMAGVRSGPVDTSYRSQAPKDKQQVQLYSYFEGAKDDSRPFTSSSGRVYLSGHAPGPWLTEQGWLASARRFIRTGRVSPYSSMDNFFTTGPIDAGEWGLKPIIPRFANFWKRLGGQYHTSIGTSGFELAEQGGRFLVNRPIASTAAQISQALGGLLLESTVDVLVISNAIYWGNRFFGGNNDRP